MCTLTPKIAYSARSVVGPNSSRIAPGARTGVLNVHSVLGSEYRSSPLKYHTVKYPTQHSARRGAMDRPVLPDPPKTSRLSTFDRPIRCVRDYPVSTRESPCEYPVSTHL